MAGGNICLTHLLRAWPVMVLPVSNTDELFLALDPTRA
jgi:hypothetical protein